MCMLVLVQETSASESLSYSGPQEGFMEKGYNSLLGQV
jgi:hypothetical protein